MISFGPTEEQEMIRDTIREFAASELRDASRPADEANATPPELMEKLWELGLVNSAIPESLGGAGMERSPVTSAILLEELGHGCASLGISAIASSLFVNPLLDFGTDEQKNAYLPLFTSSEVHTASMALHEPHFTYDASNLRAMAEPKGDGFRLTGTKRLVPLGASASHFLVVARRGVSEGFGDLEAFIVPRGAEGLKISDESEKTMGFRAVQFSQLELDGVEVSADARLGGDAGIDGARLINQCRVGTAALALGISRAVLELCVPYAKDRVAFDQPIAQKQTIAFMLAEMKIEVTTMRWMVWKAASMLENNVDATKATTLALTYVAREAMKIADNGIQVLGGHGFIREYPVEMWYRNMRTLLNTECVAAA